MKIKDLLENGKKSRKKKAARNIAIGTGLGAVVGAAAGLLLAPKSGKETRSDIANGAKKAASTVKEKINEVKEKASELTKKDGGECCCGEEKPQE